MRFHSKKIIDRKAECYNPLQKVVVKMGVEERNEREVRDLRRCCSPLLKNENQENDASTSLLSSTMTKTCPSGGKFVNRDFNAALNIAKKFLRHWPKELLEKRNKMHLEKFILRNRKKSSQRSSLPRGRDSICGASPNLKI